MEKIYTECAAVFRALGDERRLQIIQMLNNEELTASDLIRMTGMHQSTLSYHMKSLCESGIVSAREAGKWVYYTISKEGSAHAMEILKMVVDHK